MQRLPLTGWLSRGARRRSFERKRVQLQLLMSRLEVEAKLRGELEPERRHDLEVLAHTIECRRKSLV